MSSDECKVAVVLPSGLEYSSRLMTGIIYYRDEHVRFCPVEYRFVDENDDPLPESLDQFQGVIVWAHRGCGFVQRLLDESIKVVNCCFDWHGTAGVVSLSFDIEMSCDLILAHALSLSVRQFAVIGASLANRPQANRLCQRLVERATQDGLTTRLHSVLGVHPDEDRLRTVEVERETELLDFLRGLQRPAFVWCDNDHVARMICNAAAYLGLSIPSQLAVMGAGDYRVAMHNSPTITTLPRPAEQVGYAAAELIQSWIADEGHQPQDVWIPPGPVIMRNSTVNSANWDVIRTARDMIEQEACNGLTVERICRRVNLSKMILTKRYREMFGTTPGAAIANQKIESAMRMLRETRRSVAEIGADLGFSEQSKFSKFFKRQTGRTPSEYRREKG